MAITGIENISKLDNSSSCFNNNNQLTGDTSRNEDISQSEMNDLNNKHI
jgi:hypothetical protein